MSNTDDQKAEKPRRIRIFRPADGVRLNEDIMPMENVDESAMAGFGKLMAAGAGEAHAETVTCLFRDPRENGLSLCHGWFRSGFVTPRHSHNADCIYYMLGGELKMGSASLHQGDGVFIPAGAGYVLEAGPAGAQFLEVRNAPSFNIFFRENPPAHWDKIARVYQERRQDWETEPLPTA